MALGGVTFQSAAPATPPATTTIVAVDTLPTWPTAPNAMAQYVKLLGGGTGLIDPIASDGAGNLRVNVQSMPTVNVGTVTTLPAVNQGTSPWVVSGSVGITGAVTGPVTLASDPAKVIGMVNQGTSPWTVAVSGAPAAAGALPVSGVFWQTTQPISGSVDTELPVQTALGDALVPPPTPVVGAVPLGWNGTAYDRLRSTIGNGLVVDVSRLPALPSGGNVIGGVTQSGTWTVQPGNVANTTAWLVTLGAAIVPVGGSVPVGNAVTGNPVNLGAQAVAVEPAPVTAGNFQQLVADRVGKLITLPYANPEQFVSGTVAAAMTTITSTLVVAAPAAGLRNYVTQIVVSNSHATVGTDVLIQDGFGGTTLYVIPAASVYGGAVISFPTPLRQPTAATALYAACVVTGASVRVSASGYTGR